MSAVCPGHKRLMKTKAPVVDLMMLSSYRMILGIHRSCVPCFHVGRGFVKSVPTLSMGGGTFGVGCVDPLKDFTA